MGDTNQVAQDLEDERKCQYTSKNNDIFPQKYLEPHLFSLEIITKTIQENLMKTDV